MIIGLVPRVERKYEVDVEDRTYYEVEEQTKTMFSVPEEFNDYLQVMEMGAKKHGADNWLEPNGNKSSHKEMMASLFRHVAELSVGKTADKESGLHPALHVAARALMEYTRQVRGIKHKDD